MEPIIIERDNRPWIFTLIALIITFSVVAFRNKVLPDTYEIKPRVQEKPIGTLTGVLQERIKLQTGYRDIKIRVSQYGNMEIVRLNYGDNYVLDFTVFDIYNEGDPTLQDKP